MAFSAPTLACQKREVTTKSYLRQLKKDDYIPAIIYGKDQEPIPVMLGSKQVMRSFNSHGVRSIFNLDIAGDEFPELISVVRDYQIEPISGKIIHIDFMTISMTEKFTSAVSIHIIGEETVSREGGIVQTGITEIEVECLPKDLPEHITYDISDFEIGSTLNVGDLEPPAGVTFLTEPDTVIVTVVAPMREEEDEVDEDLELIDGEVPEIGEEDATEEGTEE
ncbi:MAG TPA: 50S ribosomal protein L25 [Syntrophomonadaceae bacterium]|nr:50S ribosomal protein L25 [Syntrophomonadaceae bacterium]